MKHKHTCVTIYNDGEIAVQLITVAEDTSVGTISSKLNHATPEEFLADLPVNTAFLDDIKTNAPDEWFMIEDAIKEGLEQ